MLQYSFNADLRSVLRRLASTMQACTTASTRSEQPAPQEKRRLLHTAAQQPRLEIAHIALRRRPNETHDAAT
jgi:tellurite resistance protein